MKMDPGNGVKLIPVNMHSVIWWLMEQERMFYGPVVESLSLQMAKLTCIPQPCLLRKEQVVLGLSRLPCGWLTHGRIMGPRQDISFPADD